MSWGKTILLTGLMVIAQKSTAEVPVRFRTVAELGFLSVVSHKIQFSNNGTYFNYVEDGGQDVLFPVTRLSAEMDVGKRNTFILLYQPLRIETTTLLRNDLVVDNHRFQAGEGIDLLYNFPFYRASYLRELLADNKKWDLAIGLTLQIRNATISFESTDGTGYRTNRDVGIVPALKVRGLANLTENWFVGLEADGIYAPISYLNGSDNEVVGAILDASLRAGTNVRLGTLFANVRYLGGGAVGTSTRDIWPGDGYVKNWLHFIIGSLGFVYPF
ncbi:MAG: hypothetical protein JW863_18735 [Chitinispirillaceae bacterium]|nr:hypothetical protein [Chitinispirillaceae bacterium]